MNSTFRSFFRLLVVEERRPEPEPTLSAFLRSLPERPPQWEVTVCGSLDKGYELLAGRTFEMALIDASRLGADPKAALAPLRRRHPGVAVVVAGRGEALAHLDAIYDLGVQDVLDRDRLTPEGFFCAAHGAFLRQKTLQHVTREFDSLQRRFEDQVGYLKSLIDKTQAGIVIVDQKGVVRFVNPSATELFGKPADKLVGSYFGYPLAGERALEITLPNPQGQVTVEMRATTIEWENTVCFLASLRDVSHYKEVADSLRIAEEAAKRSSRMKSEFLATMSHEIRTPLNGLLGMARLVQETPMTPAQRDLVDTIQSSGEILLTLINDILDLSKIEAGMLEFEHKEFDLQQVMKETIGVYAPLANSKNLLLATEIATDVPDRVVGDKVRFRQVLGNLVSNALKYTERGTVLVKATLVRPPSEERDCRILFSVTDTGIGIPAARFPDLFQPFRQVGGQRQASGTGLGLSICKRLVVLMGGEIDVESRVGAGSTFRFALPFRGAQYDHSLFTSPQARTRRVLVVSELEARLAVIGGLLASGGFEVTTVTLPSALDGFTWEPGAGEASIDLVVADLQGATLLAGWQGLLRTAAERAVPVLKIQLQKDEGQVRGGGQELVLSPPIHHAGLVESAKYLLSDPVVAARLTPPVSSDPLRQPRGSELPRRRPDYDGRILVAEDNLVNQQVVQRFLALLGFEFDLVADGRAAVDRCLARPYAAVLMDCRMPEMDGLQATRLIRALERRDRPTPIVALTANAMAEDVRACEAAGMDGFLAKPVRLEDLALELERLVPEAFVRAGVGSLSARAGAYAVLPPSSAALARALVPAPAPEPVAVGLGTDGDLIDEETFGALAQDPGDGALDMEFLRELLQTFLEHAPPRLRSLDEAVRGQDPQTLRNVAHSLKGSAANLGAKALADLCAGLERLAVASTVDFGQATELVAQVAQIYDGTVREFKRRAELD